MSHVIIRVDNGHGDLVELEVPIAQETQDNIEEWTQREAWVRFITLTASSDSQYYFGALCAEKSEACEQDKNSKKYFIRPDYQRIEHCGMYEDNGNGEDIVLFVRGFGY